jgi:hypothetical protein
MFVNRLSRRFVFGSAPMQRWRTNTCYLTASGSPHPGAGGRAGCRARLLASGTEIQKKEKLACVKHL